MTQNLCAVPRTVSTPARTRRLPLVRWTLGVVTCSAVLTIAACAAAPASDDTTQAPAATAPVSSPAPEASDEPVAEPVAPTQEETCDWDSPRLSAPAHAPEGQAGELEEVLIGAWQHTHTDEGSGFEDVVNDHRYVFPAANRMLYCQHVPGATDYAENAADVVLNGTAIELPGGKYAYTITAWDEDTLVWDNPVGGGFVYLLQRR